MADLILVYNGGYKYLLEDKRYFLPMGVAQLKSYLNKKNIDIDVEYISVDLTKDNQDFLHNIMVKNYVYSLEKWQAGDYDDNYLQIIKDNIGDISEYKYFGVSIMSFEDVLPSLYLLKIIKEINPEVITIMGGAYMNYVNKEIFQDNKDLIDFLVMGDGEYALEKIIKEEGDKAKLKDTAGLLFFAGNEIIENKAEYIDFNDLALPDYGFLNNPDEIYYNFSRGCARNCVFCTFKDKLQFKDFDLIKNELEQLINKYSPKRIYFIDSTANNNSKLLIEILEFLNKFEQEFEIVLWVDFYSFNDQLIESLNKFNKSVVLKFGLESGDLEIRKYLEKPDYSNHLVYEIANKLDLDNIKIHLNLIVGTPYEKEENIEKTIEVIDYLKDKIDSVGLTEFHLTPCSKIYENPDKYGIKIMEKNLNKYNFYYDYEEINGLNKDDVISRNKKHFKSITDLLDKYNINW